MKIIYIISIFLIGLIFVMVPSNAYAVVSIDWTYGGAPVFNVLPDLDTFAISNGEIASPDFPVSIQVDASDEGFAGNTLLDTIDVLITSVADPTGTTLTLTESAFDDGIFTGSNFVFLRGNYQFQVTDVVTVTISDNPATGCDTDNTITQLDGTAIAPLDGVMVFSDSEPAGIGLILTETGLNTCEFQGKLRFSLTSSDQSTGTLHVF
jgi:hypothetical protein